MHPFVHLFGMTLGSYGILMGTGMFVNYYVLKADLARRQLGLRPLGMMVAICGAGFVASKLYHALLEPALYLSHPALLLEPRGFTFYGAVIAGIGVVLLLARRHRVAPLSILDAVSAAAALGYGFGRIGCLLAGDGDYGTPTTLPWGISFPDGIVPTLARVHPTPIYEALGAALIASLLWRLGRPEIRRVLAPGEVFARYLVWSGLARFAVEFIRLNPRYYLGLSNAQWAGLCSIAAGTMLLLNARHRRPLWLPHPIGACAAAATVRTLNARPSLPPTSSPRGSRHDTDR